MEPFNQWIETFDGYLEGLLMNSMVEKEVGKQGDNATYPLSEKGKKKDGR
jgi:hypothetical protein